VQNPVEGTPANETTKPGGTTGQSDFTEPRHFLGIERQPPVNKIGLIVQNNTWRSVFIRRTVIANARRQPFAVVLVVFECTDQSPATVRSGVLLPFGLLGFTPLVTITRDRGPVLDTQQLGDAYEHSVRVGHGGRFSALVKAQETGLPVPDLEVGWALSGPGQLYTEEAPLTDSSGVSTVTYSAPSETTKTRQAITVGASFSDVVANNFVTSKSLPITIAAGTERALVAAVAAASISDGPADVTPYGGSSATFNGDPMTLISRAFTPEGLLLDWFYILSPAVGAGTLVATYPAEADAVGILSQQLAGIDQAQPIDGIPAVARADNLAGTVLSTSITTVTAGAVIVGALAAARPFDPFVVADGSQVPFTPLVAAFIGLSPIAGVIFGSTLPAPAPGSFAFGYTGLSSGSDFLLNVVALRPALSPSTLTVKV
jgi:hypothetical protein